MTPAADGDQTAAGGGKRDAILTRYSVAWTGTTTTAGFGRDRERRVAEGPRTDEDDSLDPEPPS